MGKCKNVYIAIDYDGFVVHVGVFDGLGDREMEFQDVLEKHTGQSIIELRKSRKLSHITRRVVEEIE
jgi:hypothetical protein